MPKNVTYYTISPFFSFPSIWVCLDFADSCACLKSGIHGMRNVSYYEKLNDNIDFLSGIGGRPKILLLLTLKSTAESLLLNSQLNLSTNIICKTYLNHYVYYV